MRFNPDNMYTMWACVSSRGYYHAAFRTKRAAQNERFHHRPETRIEKVSVSPWRGPPRKGARWQPMSASKILRSLQEAIDGKVGRVTFYGVDWGGKDWNAMACPICGHAHRWRKLSPQKCRGCAVELVITSVSAAKP